MNTSRRPLGTFVLGACLFAFTTLTHAVVDETVRNALNLTDHGNADAAFQMLDPMEIQRAGDPDFDLVLGIAANQSGHYTRAIFALERVLLASPNNARARVELGRAKYSVGENAAAKELFEQASNSGELPGSAAQSVKALLQSIERIDASTKSNTQSYIEFTTGYDSNVNGSPDNNLFGISGKSSNFSSLAINLSGQKVIDPRWSLIGNIKAGMRNNTSDTGASIYDTNDFSLSGGAMYRRGRDDFTLTAQAGKSFLQSALALKTMGLTTEWTHRFNEFRQSNVYLQWLELSYLENVRNVNRYVLGASLGQQFGSGLSLYGSVYYGQEIPSVSDMGFLNQTLSGVRIGAQQPLGEKFAVFATASYEERDYAQPDPFFGITRQDQQIDASLGVNWMPAQKWRITPRFQYSHALSNMPVNSFDESVASVSARLEF